MLFQIAGNTVNIDPAQLCALLQFFCGQTFSLVLCCQLIDSDDYFVHIHDFNLTHSGG